MRRLQNVSQAIIQIESVHIEWLPKFLGGAGNAGSFSLLYGPIIGDGQPEEVAVCGSTGASGRQPSKTKSTSLSHSHSHTTIGRHKIQHSQSFGVSFSRDEKVRSWMESSLDIQLVHSTVLVSKNAKSSGKQSKKATPSKRHTEVVARTSLPLKDVLFSSCLETRAILELTPSEKIRGKIALQNDKKKKVSGKSHDDEHDVDEEAEQIIVGSVGVNLKLITSEPPSSAAATGSYTFDEANSVPNKSTSVMMKMWHEEAKKNLKERKEAAATATIESHEHHPQHQHQHHLQHQHQHQHQQHEHHHQQRPKPTPLHLHASCHSLSKIDVQKATGARSTESLRVKVSCGSATTNANNTALFNLNGARPKLISTTSLNLNYCTPLNIDPTADTPPSEQLRNPKACVIFEVWAKGSQKDSSKGPAEQLVGISKISLAPLADHLVKPGSATSPAPAVVEDGFVDIRNPFKNQVVGKIQVLVAAGLDRQVVNVAGFKGAASKIQRRWKMRNTPSTSSPSATTTATAIAATATTATTTSTTDVTPKQSASPSRKSRIPTPKVFYNANTASFRRSYEPTDNNRRRNPTTISYNNLKDTYLRKSMDAMFKSEKEDKEEKEHIVVSPPRHRVNKPYVSQAQQSQPSPSRGLTKHVLEFKADSTCQLPNSNSNNPWGCYVRYLIPWESNGSGVAGGASHSEARANDVQSLIPPMANEQSSGIESTLLWWDADSPLLNEDQDTRCSYLQRCRWRTQSAHPMDQ